jgi:rSAM/selenodomain-associated transferase 1
MQSSTTSDGHRPERVLGVFTKWPEPGTAKTRLASDDPNWNVRVAQAFLLDTLQRLAVVNARRLVAFAPADREAEFAAVAAGRFALSAQAEGDLGKRLSAFVQQELDNGARAVVAVGTDSPTLPVAYVERAFADLETADVVLGPATDGGYYLVGCACVPGGLRPPIFEGVAWSTARVLADTVFALADPRWRLALLPPWYDIDTLADWVMLRGHLAALRRADIDPGVPHTEALIRQKKVSGPFFTEEKGS